MPKYKVQITIIVICVFLYNITKVTFAFCENFVLTYDKGKSSLRPLATEKTQFLDIKIISGGQTGSDRGALEGARQAGLKTGGTAPRGYMTEKGSDFTLRDFGLVEGGSSDYRERTERNIIDSDGTVIFADDIKSRGTQLTIYLANKHKRPYIINPSAEELRKFAGGKKVINVAGNRESKAPGIQQRVAGIIILAFGQNSVRANDAIKAAA